MPGVVDLIPILVQAGGLEKGMADALIGQLKQGLLFEGEVKAVVEQELVIAYNQALIDQHKRLVKFLSKGGGWTPGQKEWDAFWNMEDEALWKSLEPNINKAAVQLGVQAGTGKSGPVSEFNNLLRFAKKTGAIPKGHDTQLTNDFHSGKIDIITAKGMIQNYLDEAAFHGSLNNSPESAAIKKMYDMANQTPIESDWDKLFAAHAAPKAGASAKTTGPAKAAPALKEYMDFATKAKVLTAEQVQKTVALVDNGTYTAESIIDYIKSKAAAMAAIGKLKGTPEGQAYTAAFEQAGGSVSQIDWGQVLTAGPVATVGPGPATAKYTPKVQQAMTFVVQATGTDNVVVADIVDSLLNFGDDEEMIVNYLKGMLAQAADSHGLIGSQAARDFKALDKANAGQIPDADFQALLDKHAPSQTAGKPVAVVPDQFVKIDVQDVTPVLPALVKQGYLTQADADKIDSFWKKGLYTSLDVSEAIEKGIAKQANAGAIAPTDPMYKLAQKSVGSKEWDAFWDQEDAALWNKLMPIAPPGTTGVIEAIPGLGTDAWMHVNQPLIDWAHTHYTSKYEHGSIPNLNQTSRQQVEKAFAAWQKGELEHKLGITSLALELQPIFGESRARTIAVTETTRIHAYATRWAAGQDPDVVYLRWMTAADEITCPICWPLHGQVIGKKQLGFTHPELGKIGLPPAHPNCRCVITEETEQSVKVPLKDTFLADKGGGQQPAPPPPKAPTKPPTKPPVAPAIVPAAPVGVNIPQAPVAPVAAPPVAPVGPSTPVVPAPAGGKTNEAYVGPLVQWDRKLADPDGSILNGIEFKKQKNIDWASIKDKPVTEPALPALTGGKTQSAGMVVVEDDGRVWMYKPSGSWGGVTCGFPKGGLNAGETLQQAAMREMFEETGIVAEVQDYLGDMVGGYTQTRFYVGKRVGGAPWASGHESASVLLGTVDEAAKLLDQKGAQGMLSEFKKWYADQGLKPIAPTVIPNVPGYVKQTVAPPPAKAPAYQPSAPKPGKQSAVFTPAPPPPTKSVQQAIVPATLHVFPADPGKLERVSSLGGSTGAELVRDPETGVRYVRKKGASPEHLREECYADAAYRALGVNVPEFKLYEGPGGKPVKLSVYLDETVELGKLRDQDPIRYERVRRKVQNDFGADVALGNWDVAGQGMDNILVDRNDNPWRIDNGGSMRYRAQGTQKTAAQWNGYPDELWSLRDAKVNRITAGVFGDVDFDAMVQQLSDVGGLWDSVEGALTDAPDDLKAVLKQRFRRVGELGDAGVELRRSRFKVGYSDTFLREHLGMDKAGVFDNLPTEATFAVEGGPPGSGGVYMYDQNGKQFDDLRGQGGVIGKWSKYVESIGGKPGVAAEYMGSQAGSSWNDIPKVFKAWLADQVDVPDSEIFWGNKGASDVRGERTRYFRNRGVSEQEYEATMRAMHVLNYRTLTNMRMPDIARQGNLLRLWRTETDNVITKYGIGTKEGESTTAFTRGIAESTSLIIPCYPQGSYLTEQYVPIINTFANWMFSAPNGYDTGCSLYGNRENEIVAYIPKGTKVTYRGYHIYISK